MRNSPIVVLDEATAFADPENEEEIVKALANLTRGKTVLVIAHRLSTISHADNIVVVEDGTILENGRHEELLNKKGRYAKMFEAQQRIKKWNMLSA